MKWSMLQSEAMLFASAMLLLLLLVRVAMLQSRLITAAGAWQQHRSCMTDVRSSQRTSVCSTSAAELYYLRHARSCAATASGSKGSHPGQSIVRERNGVAVAWTMLLHIWNTFISQLQPMLILLQSVWPTTKRFADAVPRQIVAFLALIQSALELLRKWRWRGKPRLSWRHAFTWSM